MNPLYQMLTGQKSGTPVQQAVGGAPYNGNQPMFSGQQYQFRNPWQKAQFLMQAMRNPAAFVKQHIPDIPENIQNDPNQILQYLQQTRGVTNEQIQQLAQQIPRF